MSGICVLNLGASPSHTAPRGGLAMHDQLQHRREELRVSCSGGQRGSPRCPTVEIRPKKYGLKRGWPQIPMDYNNCVCIYIYI